MQIESRSRKECKGTVALCRRDTAKVHRWTVSTGAPLQGSVHRTSTTASGSGPCPVLGTGRSVNVGFADRAVRATAEPETDLQEEPSSAVKCPKALATHQCKAGGKRARRAAGAPDSDGTERRGLQQLQHEASQPSSKGHRQTLCCKRRSFKAKAAYFSY